MFHEILHQKKYTIHLCYCLYKNFFYILHSSVALTTCNSYKIFKCFSHLTFGQLLYAILSSYRELLLNYMPLNFAKILQTNNVMEVSLNQPRVYKCAIRYSVCVSDEFKLPSLQSYNHNLQVTSVENQFALKIISE